MDLNDLYTRWNKWIEIQNWNELKWIQKDQNAIDKLKLLVDDPDYLICKHFTKLSNKLDLVVKITNRWSLW